MAHPLSWSVLQRLSTCPPAPRIRGLDVLGHSKRHPTRVLKVWPVLTFLDNHLRSEAASTGRVSLRPDWYN